VTAPAGKSGERGRIRPHAYAILFLLGVVILAHAHLLRLPYFWDELGQFVPAALDILRAGQWVPHSTVPNVHPPGVMAYLALVWKITGYSLPATRLAMLVLAAAGLYAAFVLAVRMCREVPGAPAFSVVLLLFVTPLFYTQAIMAQLDMPAMVFTTLALVLFLDRRYVGCTAACTVLVLVKETGLMLPAVFGAWLLFRERQARAAFLFVLPALALAGWLIVLKNATGNWLGDTGFAHYNVEYSLSPVRTILAFVRRIWYVFFADFRWLSTAAIIYAIRRTRLFFTPEWTIAGIFCAAHILLVTLFGGATLERYLLPVFPVYYIAAATAFAVLAKRIRWAALAALTGGLYLGWFWNAPYPFPLENNIAMFDFVELHQAAAEYLERDAASSKIATAWPLTGALRRSDLFYVGKPLSVVETSDFHVHSVVDTARRENPDVLVLYSRTWEPRFGILQLPLVETILRKYYDYEPQITATQVEERLGLYPRFRFHQRGQWIEVYTR
jgi:hypothetical protein